MDLLKFPRKFIGKIIVYFISRKGGIIYYFYERDGKNVLDFIKKVKGETDMRIDINEGYQIYLAVKKTEKIEGDIAEVGTYAGGSSKIICETKGNKTLYLFDTFEGLPIVNKKYDKRFNNTYFYRGEFNISLESVKNYLKEYKNVYFYKGIFPKTAEPIKNKKFSFVHLDVDIYKSTLDCLKFFYPRMSKGGMIISHDYTNTTGVKKAFDEFFKDKPEPIIELLGRQCLVVKI